MSVSFQFDEREMNTTVRRLLAQADRSIALWVPGLRGPRRQLIRKTGKAQKTHQRDLSLSIQSADDEIHLLFIFPTGPRSRIQGNKVRERESVCSVRRTMEFRMPRRTTTHFSLDTREACVRVCKTLHLVGGKHYA